MVSSHAKAGAVSGAATTAAAATNINQPTGDARAQRRAVKQVALAVDHEIRELGRIGMLNRDVGKLDDVLRRLEIGKQKLDRLRTGGFEAEVPRSSVLRQARSGAVLSAAMASRVGAVLTASAVGVGEGTVAAVSSPVLCAIHDGRQGYNEGRSGKSALARPVGAVIGMALGAVGGAISGAFGAVLAAPVAVGRNGSMTRKTFRYMDQLPIARAHVARKKLSTRDIAVQTQAALAQALRDASQQREQAEFFSDAPNILRGMAEAYIGAMNDGRR